MMASNDTFRRRPRQGFTLTEMLVIIGVILLVLAIALPAFTAIVGSRSIESARNIVAASVVRARGEAIRRGQPCGVFFYVDGETADHGELRRRSAGGDAGRCQEGRHGHEPVN